MRRIGLIGLCLCLLLAGCSPAAVFEPVITESGVAAEAPAESPALLRLPVNLSDSLNPYQLTTQVNQSIVALIYDSLFRLTPDYDTEPLIAGAATMEGTVWRVTIKPNLVFSDGAAITAQDVIYSYQMAISLNSPYRTQLRQVQSCFVQEGAVVFTLIRPNRLFLANLTFPVVKSGTGAQAIPIGSGRFVPGQADSSGMILTPGRDNARCGPIKEVQLVAMGEDATIASSLKVGTVDMMQTTQSSRDEFLSGVDSQTLDINTLNFLAVNQSAGALSDPAVRRAIYLAINREELAHWSYGSKAIAAYTPFNPAVDWLPDAEFVGRDGLNRANSYLEEAGYITGGDGVRAGEEQALRFELLVNSDNEVRVSAAHRLRDQLARAGVAVTVVARDYAAYAEAYATGRYELCLAEMQMGDDMTLDLILPGIATLYGKMSVSYNQFLADAEQTDLFLADFLEEHPFIPLVYRYGALASSRNFNVHMVATKWDIFYNMADW